MKDREDYNNFFKFLGRRRWELKEYMIVIEILVFSRFFKIFLANIPYFLKF